MRLVSAAVLAAILCAAPAAVSAAADPAPKAESKAGEGAKPTPQEIAERDRLIAVLNSLKPQTGTIVVPGADSRLVLGDQYYFLGKDDAHKVLVDLWGNPADATEGVLGMVFPKGVTPVSKDAWAAVVTWQDTGYVSDSDAKKMDYNDLVAKMREGEDQDNEARKKGGFDPAHLVGWAQPPSYDAKRHLLIWAKDLKFGAQTDDTLNYDVRVLGRKGVLSLNIVSSMSQLQQVRGVAEGVGKTAVFDAGARYEDFNQSTDKRAAFGLAGLILGGGALVVAKKVGLLGLILAFGKKFIVLILAAFGGAGAWISRQWKRLFGRRRDASDIGN